MRSALNEDFLIKTADDSIVSWATSALSGIASSIASTFKTEASNPSEFLLKSLEEGAILKIVHNYLGGYVGDAIYLGLKALGLDVSGIINSVITSLVKPLLSSAGATIGSYDVQQSVQSLFPSGKTAADLRKSKLIAAGIPVKQAAGFGTVSFLTSIFTWIISAILWGAGLLTVESAAQKYFGTNNYGAKPQDSKDPPPNMPTSVTPSSKSIQTEFKPNPNYNDDKFSREDYVVYIDPNYSNIASLFSGYATEVYSGLDGLHNLIINNHEFKKLVASVTEDNKNNHLKVTFLPKVLNSKKEIVDIFIDGVAADFIKQKPIKSN